MIPLIVAISLLVGFIAGYALKSLVAKKALDALKKEQSPFAVEVRPYSEEYRNDGWFTGEHEFRVGYQYQLLLHGIPCFEPHVTIERSWKEKHRPEKGEGSATTCCRGCRFSFDIEGWGGGWLLQNGQRAGSLAE